MNAVQLDASRRIADVNRMIAYQTLVKSELRKKGLAAEPAQNLIDILQCCLLVIEGSQPADEEDLDAPSLSVVANNAASPQAA
jgi:hypothetical protein